MSERFYERANSHCAYRGNLEEKKPLSNNAHPHSSLLFQNRTIQYNPTERHGINQFPNTVPDTSLLFLATSFYCFYSFIEFLQPLPEDDLTS